MVLERFFWHFVDALQKRNMVERPIRPGTQAGMRMAGDEACYSCLRRLGEFTYYGVGGQAHPALVQAHEVKRAWGEVFEGI